MLILLLFSSLINNYIEIFNRKISKPEFRKTLKVINSSNTKYIGTNAPEKFIEIVDNYIKSTKEFKNLNIVSLKNIDNKIKNFWFKMLKSIKFKIWKITYIFTYSFIC